MGSGWNGAGRPMRFGKEELEIFLDVYRVTAPNVTRAMREARLLGSGNGGRMALQRARQRLPWLDEAMTEIENEAFDEIEEKVFRKARKGHGQNARFLLTHHRIGRERGYGARTEVTGARGTPLSWADLMREASAPTAEAPKTSGEATARGGDKGGKFA